MESPVETWPGVADDGMEVEIVPEMVSNENVMLSREENFLTAMLGLAKLMAGLSYEILDKLIILGNK